MSSNDGFFVVGHGVKAFDNWLKAYDKTATLEEGGLHKSVLKLHMSMACKQATGDDTKEASMVFGTFPVSSADVVADALKFDKPPFPDLVKSGDVMLPCDPLIQCTLAKDIVLEENPSSPLMIQVHTHGTGGFDTWLEAFNAVPHQVLTEQLGLVRILAGKVVGTEDACIIHVLKKSFAEANREFASLASPPFPDLIAKGIVVLPLQMWVADVVEQRKFD